MRAFKAIVVVIVVLVAIACVIPYAVSPYIRFMGKAPSYYTQFAHACDSLMQQHPIGVAGFAELSPSDTMLPAIIRELHARKVRVSTNGVSILVGVGRGGFGISWGPDDTRQLLDSGDQWGRLTQNRFFRFEKAAISQPLHECQYSNTKCRADEHNNHESEMRANEGSAADAGFSHAVSLDQRPGPADFVRSA